MVYPSCTALSLRICISVSWDGSVAAAYLDAAQVWAHSASSPEHSQTSRPMSRYSATKGALVQSVLTRPPCVAQSSADQMLEKAYIGRFVGNGTPLLA